MCGNTDGVVLPKQKTALPLGYATMQRRESQLTENTMKTAPYQTLWRMRCSTPSFPLQGRTSQNPLVKWWGIWSRHLKKAYVQLLPDSEDDEIPWHDEQPEELK